MWFFSYHSGSGTFLVLVLYPREATCWQTPSYSHRACWEGFQNKLDLLDLGHDTGTENLLHSPAVVMVCFECRNTSPVYSASITSLLCVAFLQRDWISPPAKEMTYVSAFCLHLEREIHSCVCRNVEAVVHEAGPDTLTLRCKLFINSILMANFLCYKLTKEQDPNFWNLYA